MNNYLLGKFYNVEYCYIWVHFSYTILLNNVNFRKLFIKVHNKFEMQIREGEEDPSEGNIFYVSINLITHLKNIEVDNYFKSRTTVPKFKKFKFQSEVLKFNQL